MDPSIILALKLKQIMEGELKHFERTKKAKIQTEITIYFPKVTHIVPASPAAPSISSTSSTLPPLRQQDQPLLFLLLLSIFRMRMVRMKDPLPLNK